ncbi:hypothetical protein Anapl_09195 [Anas platyrhynchos]|uniref:Uncharacterized protein n=1 Tax=Anas platyrhynchos TaxID=8839 RepID=R0L2P2_ANAPL|nr:hypothetical protein Anapl_09195 [Anas platyrhynchos]
MRLGSHQPTKAHLHNPRSLEAQTQWETQILDSDEGTKCEGPCQGCPTWENLSPVVQHVVCYINTVQQLPHMSHRAWPSPKRTCRVRIPLLRFSGFSGIISWKAFFPLKKEWLG